jgi:hypothetical protein
MPLLAPVIITTLFAILEVPIAYFSSQIARILIAFDGTRLMATVGRHSLRAGSDPSKDVSGRYLKNDFQLETEDETIGPWYWTTLS